MTVYTLERVQEIPRGVNALFEFFGDAENLNLLTPPWISLDIITPRPIAMHTGTLIDYRLRWGPVPMRWRTLIERWNPPYDFVDMQVRGPYRLWRHTHRFETTDHGTRMTDMVEYALPLGPIGRLVHWAKVGDDLRRIFDYRAAVIREQFGEVPAACQASR